MSQKCSFFVLSPVITWQHVHFGGRQPTASYIGSDRSGLGFYHIDLPKAEITKWLNLTNSGDVKIIRGYISLVELEKELLEIFCKEWPWQMRELTPS
jgi:hypothetical protein